MLKDSLRKVARAAGYGIVRLESPAQAAFTTLLDARGVIQAADQTMAGQFLAYTAANLTSSCAQRFQDLFAAFFHRDKSPGYFVEFGAADGLYLSNTAYLERRGWRGICAEPARHWQAALSKNRSCHVEQRCVWTVSNMKLSFNETVEPELSTIEEFSGTDDYQASRIGGEHYTVNTVSLTDMLTAWNAPALIDYMSVDTEGSEFAILSAFDFDKYKITTMSVEHNFRSTARDQLHELLTGQGMVRVMEDYSQFDDWYVQKERLVALGYRSVD